MPKKKTVARKKKEETKKVATESRKYFFGIGRRKSSVARVKITKTSGKSVIAINGKELKEYIPLAELSGIASSPLDVLGGTGNFSVVVKVTGGGVRGQAEAVRLGLARAIVAFKEDLKKPLRDLGYLTRDDRVVERKKAGLKKARRAPQWQKR